jgi:hypothetical protein
MQAAVNHEHADRASALTEAGIGVAFQALTGLQARSADVRAVQLLGADTATLAEYVWDHVMGEPDEVSPAELQRHLERHVEETRSIARELGR